MLAFIHSEWGYPSSFAGAAAVAAAASVAANDDCRKCIALSERVCVCACWPGRNPSLICRSAVLKISFAFQVNYWPRLQHCPRIPVAIPIPIRAEKIRSVLQNNKLKANYFSLLLLVDFSVV